MGAAGVAAPLLSACTTSSDSGQTNGKPVRVALVVPQSGALQPMGDEMTAGFNLFLARSGNVLGGRKVSVSVHDEGDSVSSGQSAVSAILKGSQADVIVGVANSDVLSKIRVDVENAQVPLIAAGNSPTVLFSPKYIWRASYVGGEVGAAAATYFNQAKLGHVFVYDDGTSDGKAEAEKFRSTYAGAMTSASGSAAQVINQIKSSGADVVFASATGARAIDFVKQYAGNVSKPLYGPGFLTEGYVLKEERAAARSIYTVFNYSADLDNDANRVFAAAYFNADNDQAPSMYAMAAYDALNILDRAIRTIQGNATPLAINAALGRAGQFESPRGDWQFNQNRNPQQSWYLRQVRRDGRVWLNTVIQSLMVPVQTA